MLGVGAEAEGKTMYKLNPISITFDIFIPTSVQTQNIHLPLLK